jgi:hypothetical protein
MDFVKYWYKNRLFRKVGLEDCVRDPCLANFVHVHEFSVLTLKCGLLGSFAKLCVCYLLIDDDEQAGEGWRKAGLPSTKGIRKEVHLRSKE